MPCIDGGSTSSPTVEVAGRKRFVTIASMRRTLRLNQRKGWTGFRMPGRVPGTRRRNRFWRHIRVDGRRR